MPKLDQKANMYLDKILKHYPMPNKDQKQNIPEPKYPQQHLHDYRKERQIYDRPTNQKLSSMKMFKEQGNNHYKNQRYKQASYFYQKVIIYSDYTFPEQQKDCQLMEQLLQQTNCNQGICLVKVNQWESAKVNFNEATKGKNMKIKAKALYWLTKYYLRTADEAKAKQTMNKINEMGAPYCQCLTQLQSLLKTTQQNNGQSQKKLCSNMFK